MLSKVYKFFTSTKLRQAFDLIPKNLKDEMKIKIVLTEKPALASADKPPKRWTLQPSSTLQPHEPLWEGSVLRCLMNEKRAWPKHFLNLTSLHNTFLVVLHLANSPRTAWMPTSCALQSRPAIAKASSE